MAKRVKSRRKLNKTGKHNDYRITTEMSSTDKEVPQL